MSLSMSKCSMPRARCVAGPMSSTRGRPVVSASATRGERQGASASSSASPASVSLCAGVLAAGLLVAGEPALASQQVFGDLAAKAPEPVVRKKGKVVIQKTKVKNFAQESIVPDVVPKVSLPGSDYKRGEAPKPKAPRERKASSGSGFKFSAPSFNGPSVKITIPSFSAPSVSPSEVGPEASTQALAVLGAEIVAFGLASATVGSLTKN